MHNKILEVDLLTKLYKKTAAVNSLSFSVSSGEILGLIGANGAGKTTTIAMILGLVLPTSGNIRIFGYDPAKQRSKVLERMNFSSPYVDLPHRLTVMENLTIYADLYSVTDKNERIEEVSRKLDISDLLRRRYGKLSSGQKTRVAMAKAMLNEPDLLLLDEPTVSLDPDVAEKARDLIISYRNSKKASVLISSHNMQEIQRICDRVIILKQGKKIAEGSPDEVILKYGHRDLEEVFIDIARREEDNP